MQATDTIENRTFDEIEVGDSASLERRLTSSDIKLFAVMSGDVNPAHVDEDYAKSSRFHEIIAHGMWGASLISTVLGTELPGPGTIYLGQTLRFRRPVRLGDVVTVTVAAREKDPDRHRIVFDCRCTNQEGEVVIAGEAEVMAPTEKVRRPRAVLPQVRLAERAHLHALLEASAELAPLRVAVVHPAAGAALRAALEAAEAGLATPLLVGPEHKIRAAADAEGIDIAPYRLVPTEHSHAAAREAVALARRGEVDALMQGSLALTELLQAVLNAASGLRTERRLSHVYAFDVPTYPRLLLLTDAGIHVTPTLEHKRDIVQNAVGLAQAIGITQPKVAILSALEQVTPRIPSTLDAAALCKMAERGQISGGVLDGPLAFDDAVSAQAESRVVSAVSGRADVLVVPDLESGSMLAEQLQHLGDAEAASIVLGARVPILPATPEEAGIARLASLALATLAARGT